MTTDTCGTADRTARLAHGAERIEALARAAGPEPEFLRQFLAELVEATAAHAGTIWRVDAEDRAVRLCHHAGDSVAPPVADPAIFDAIRYGRTDGDRLIVPFTGDELRAAVELRFEESQPEGVPPEVAPFVEEMCACAVWSLAWRREAESVATHVEFARRFQQVMLRLHGSLSMKEVAAVAAHDGRSLLGCDRVAVAVRAGNRCKILAISGNGQVNPRSDLVRRASELCGRVITSGLPLTGASDTVPAVLAQAQVRYLEESGSRGVLVVPLFGPDVSEPKSPADRPREAFAALLVEQFSETWLSPLALERVGRLAEQTSAALSNARAHEGLFLLPLWRALGRWWGALRQRSLLVGIVGCLLIVGIGALLAVPCTYRVEASGRLVPTLQRKVFAPTDGEVVDVYVRGGERVAAGQPVVRLRNDDLHAEWLKLRTDLDEQRQRRVALQAELDVLTRTASRDDATRVRGQLARTVAEIRGLDERLQALEAERELLTVRAPVAGLVATADLETLLRHRPVRRGDLLLEVMDDQGAWQLELDVPAHRIGHVLEGQSRQHTASLPVEFLLTTDPARRFHGRTTGMTTRAELSPQGALVVKLHAALDSTVPRRPIGVEAEAKIDCGRYCLGYVLFGDLVEYLRTRLW